MKLISHRGNLRGKNPLKENSPSYIAEALAKGYDVEIDVRYIEKEKSFYLGHDAATYIVDNEFLICDELWCHAKDIDTFHRLLRLQTNCFFHNVDDVVLTSRGFLWTYPGKKLTDKSICVLPESQSEEQDIKKCYGICSDFIERYKRLK
jgi:hypothetical protein